MQTINTSAVVYTEYLTACINGDLKTVESVINRINYTKSADHSELVKVVWGLAAACEYNEEEIVKYIFESYITGKIYNISVSGLINTSYQGAVNIGYDPPYKNITRTSLMPTKRDHIPLFKVLLDHLDHKFKNYCLDANLDLISTRQRIKSEDVIPLLNIGVSDYYLPHQATTIVKNRDIRQKEVHKILLNCTNLNVDAISCVLPFIEY